jgi:hypothetical protein
MRVWVFFVAAIAIGIATAAVLFVHVRTVEYNGIHAEFDVGLQHRAKLLQSRLEAVVAGGRAARGGHCFSHAL